MTDGEWGIRRVVTRRVWLVGACSAPLGLVWSRRVACVALRRFSSSRVGVDDSGPEVGKAAREGEMRLV